MKQALFRDEVINARTNTLNGDVRLDADLASWMIAALLAAIVGFMVAVLVLGDYPRRETVTGHLRPEGGIALVKTDRAGRILDIHAREGETVAAGAPLVTIGRDIGLVGGTQAHQQLLAQIRMERAQVQKQLDLIEAQTDKRLTLLDVRRKGVDAERASLEEQLQVLGQRVALARQNFENAQKLAGGGAVTQVELAAREDRYLEALESLSSVRTALSRNTQTRAETQVEMASLAVDADVHRAEIRERLAMQDQRITDAIRAHKVVLHAPFDGVVSAVLQSVGEDVDRGASVMSVLPQGALLHAELFVPSHAAGFLSEGQPVRLRYDAFPHQKFGVAEGRIAQVSRSAISGHGLTANAAAAEPVFRVVADLSAQSVTAYGNEMPLRSGMTLAADVVLEKRSLWSLLTDPIRAAAVR